MNMHRSTKVRFLFLMPAVCWVLIFTLFPLCYSLYISFHKVENRLNVTREKVPVLDQEGNPELSKSGKPRTRIPVHPLSMPCVGKLSATVVKVCHTSYYTHHKTCR